MTLSWSEAWIHGVEALLLVGFDRATAARSHSGGPILCFVSYAIMTRSPYNLSEAVVHQLRGKLILLRRRDLPELDLSQRSDGIHDYDRLVQDFDSKRPGDRLQSLGSALDAGIQIDSLTRYAIEQSGFHIPADAGSEFSVYKILTANADPVTVSLVEEITQRYMSHRVI